MAETILNPLNTKLNQIRKSEIIKDFSTFSRAIKKTDQQLVKNIIFHLESPEYSACVFMPKIS